MRRLIYCGFVLYSFLNTLFFIKANFWKFKDLLVSNLMFISIIISIIIIMGIGSAFRCCF
jgi:hypothetical protein